MPQKRVAEQTSISQKSIVGEKEVIRHLKILCDYAYEQGFHELGYDPVDEITKILNEARADK
jgi:hypothetical protein